MFTVNLADQDGVMTSRNKLIDGDRTTCVSVDRKIDQWQHVHVIKTSWMRRFVVIVKGTDRVTITPSKMDGPPNLISLSLCLSVST